MQEMPIAPEKTEVPFWHRTWVRTVAFLSILLVIIVCCCLPLAGIAWSKRAVILAPWNQSAAPSTVYDGTTEKVVDDGYRKFRPDASWIGDDFNVEMTTPATVHGPANLEIEPHMGFSCALIRVNEGESLKVIGGGAYWEAGSTGALLEMWEHHKDKYLSNYPQCAQHVYESVAAFLLANPTYVK